MANGGEALAPGVRLEEFEIGEQAGSGGFGVTYEALDVALGRRVAVKEYLPYECGSRRADGGVGPRSAAHAKDYGWGLSRFLEEARALARFDHPNVVRVYRVFEALGTAYLVTEYVEGPEGRPWSLADELKSSGPLPESRVRGLVEALSSGLSEVHDAGLTHCDIKPANVMLRADGSPVLIDFGAARQALGRHSRSVKSVVSPPYAPIEQYGAKGRQGPWTDVYALGAVAYEALSGRVPEEAPDRAGEDPLVPLSAVAAVPVSVAFASAVDSALSFRGEDRPRDLAAWLGMWSGGSSVAVASGGHGDDGGDAIGSGRRIGSPPGSDAEAAGPQVGPAPERAAEAVGPGVGSPPESDPEVVESLRVGSPPGSDAEAVGPWIGSPEPRSLWRVLGVAAAVLLAVAAGFAGWRVVGGSGDAGVSPSMPGSVALPGSGATPGAGSSNEGSSGPDPVPTQPDVADPEPATVPDPEPDPEPPSPESVEEALGLDRAERRLVQEGLAASGYDPGPADGVFGPATRRQVSAWQEAEGRTPTGYLSEPEFEMLVAAADPVPSDDHGDTEGRATVVRLGDSTAGVLETSRDVDYFRLRVAQAGELTVETAGNTDTMGRLSGAGVERTNDDGGVGTNFRIVTNVTQGDYAVRVSAYGNYSGDYTLRTLFDPDDDGNDDGNFEGGSLGAIAGTVTDSTGDGLSGVVIEALSQELSGGAGGEDYRVVETDDAGEYSMAYLRPGMYTVTLWLPGFRALVYENLRAVAGAIHQLDGVLSVGSLEATITIDLDGDTSGYLRPFNAEESRALGTITGMAIDSAGDAVTGALVEVMSAELIRSVVTSRAGTYSIGSLPPGMYTVAFTRTGFARRVYEDLPLEIGATQQLVGKMWEPEMGELETRYWEDSVFQMFEVERTINETLANGDSTLETGQYVDRWYIDVVAGDVVRIWALSEDFDLSFRLTSPSGGVINDHDLFEDEIPRGAGAAMRAGRTGQYQLEVTSRDVGESGDYDIFIGIVTAAEQALHPVQSLTKSRTLQHSDSADLWSFFCDSGEELEISVVSDDFDTYLRVTSPDGTTVEDDDGGSGLNSYVEMGASGEGPCLFEVTSVSGGAGTYEISLRSDAMF